MRQFLQALTISVIVGASVAPAAVARSVPSPSLWSPTIRGVLRDASGAATSGAIAVYAVHADESGLSFEPLATQAVSGNFAIHLAGAARERVQALASSGDGHVNVAVPAVTDEGRAMTFGTLVDPVTSAGGAAALRVRLTADHPRVRGDAQRLQRVRASTNSPSVLGYHPSWCNYQVTSIADTDTTVGEMHVIPGVSETFRYGVTNTADTDISVAVNIAGGAGGFQLDGTYHVSNTDTVVQGRTRNNVKYGKVLKSEFRYVKYHKPGTAYPLDCLAADDDYIIATHWNGGWTEGTDVSSLDNSCGSYTKINEYSGDDWTRDQSELKTWTGAATLWGVGFTAKSGSSPKVTIAYTFGGPTGTHYWLCGNDAGPSSSHRVFVDKV